MPLRRLAFLALRGLPVGDERGEFAATSRGCLAATRRLHSARLRRGGRAVEGARLESVYTVMNRIAGSNPAPSASALTP
jgi:hypothetical protein